jgi:hypothetical protein
MALQRFGAQPAQKAVARGIERLGRRTLSCCDQIKSDLEDALYPFEHGQGEVSIASYLFPTKPSSSDPVELLCEIGGALDRFEILLAQVQAFIGETAEKVELAAGFEKSSPPRPVTLDDEIDFLVSNRPTPQESASPGLQLLQTAAAVLLAVGVSMFGVAGSSISSTTIAPKHQQYEATLIPQKWSVNGGPSWVVPNNINTQRVRSYIPWNTGPRLPIVGNPNQRNPGQHQPYNPYQPTPTHIMPPSSGPQNPWQQNQQQRNPGAGYNQPSIPVPPNPQPGYNPGYQPRSQPRSYQPGGRVPQPSGPGHTNPNDPNRGR